MVACGCNFVFSFSFIKELTLVNFVQQANNRHVTRIDVFLSLIRFLQQTNTSGIDSSNKNCDVIDANI